MQLQDLAKVYRKSAAEAIFPGLTYPSYRRSPNSLLKENPSGKESRAFATGNLLTKFISSPTNLPKEIGKKIIDTKGRIVFQLSLDIAPPGAPYGFYVHEGTTKMLKRPFAELGASEPKFVSAIDEFMGDKSDEYVAGEIDKVDNMFDRAGFTIS